MFLMVWGAGVIDLVVTVYQFNLIRVVSYTKSHTLGPILCGKKDSYCMGNILLYTQYSSTILCVSFKTADFARDQ